MDNNTILIIALCGLIMSIGVVIKQMYHCKSGCLESDCVKPSSRKATLTPEESAIVNLQSEILRTNLQPLLNPIVPSVPANSRTSTPVLTISDDIYSEIIRSPPIPIPQSPRLSRKSDTTQPLLQNPVPYKAYSSQSLYVNDNSPRPRTTSDPSKTLKTTSTLSNC